LLRQRSCAACTCIIVTSTSERRARCNWPSKVGRATVVSTPVIETTASSSISVKPPAAPRLRARGCAVSGRVAHVGRIIDAVHALSRAAGCRASGSFGRWSCKVSKVVCMMTVLGCLYGSAAAVAGHRALR
jgi:hypothetical protein